MKKITKPRNIILAAITFLVLALLAYLVSGIFSINGVYYTQKAYMDNPDGANITVVDFNQFDCDICRNVYPALKKALVKDGKVRYIPRILKSDNDFGNTVVRAVYAAGLQGKYIQMHDAIYKNWPIESRDRLFSVAKRLGLDIEQLQIDMDSKIVEQKIQKNDSYFEAWHLPSVPAFLIDKKIIYMPNRDNLPTVGFWLEKFESVRKEK